MKNSERTWAILFILTSVGMAILFAYIAATRVSTKLESGLLQAFILFTSLTGSFIFSRQSASDAAKALIRPHARSAFRRLLSLYRSLQRVSRAIESCTSPAEYPITLATLKAIVGEQLATADDALEDWVDIVPEDVQELREKLPTARD